MKLNDLMKLIATAPIHVKNNPIILEFMQKDITPKNLMDFVEALEQLVMEDKKERNK